MFSSSLLFANDDVLTQWIMTEVLRGAGFTVTGACRATEVAELLAETPEFDVLIADLDLPAGGRRVDIGHCWQSARPGRPVIYTGVSRAILTRPLQYGESFLPAPFSASLLLQTVDRALEEASLHSFAAPKRRLHHVH